MSLTKFNYDEPVINSKDEDLDNILLVFLDPFVFEHNAMQLDYLPFTYIPLAHWNDDEIVDGAIASIAENQHKRFWLVGPNREYLIGIAEQFEKKYREVNNLTEEDEILKIELFDRRSFLY